MNTPRPHPENPDDLDTQVRHLAAGISAKFPGLATWGISYDDFARAVLDLGYRFYGTPGLGRYRKPPPLSPTLDAATAQRVAMYERDVSDLVRGRRAHEGHTQRQVSRRVVCSCGASAQGRLPQ